MALTFNTPTGTFGNKNAGVGKSVTLGTVALLDGSGLASNYTLANPAALTASITPRAASVSGASNKTVNLAMAYSGVDAGNYIFSGKSSAVASIAPKVLTIGGLSALDKVYDGTTATVLTGSALSGLVGIGMLTFNTPTGTFANKKSAPLAAWSGLRR